MGDVAVDIHSDVLCGVSSSRAMPESNALMWKVQDVHVFCEGVDG